MPEIRRCPQCGTAVRPDAPEGLCPECLLKEAMTSGSDPGQEPEVTGTYVHASIPPSLEEVAKQFPQLEILQLLGQGGMGIVYKARQPRLDRLVALKILPVDAGRDPAFAERFAREARALAKLTHPSIVAVYDFGESDERFYLLMEFVDGVNLRHLLRERRLKPQEALQILPKICEALQYAHDQGVIHRDIKPENILLDKRGNVKIADFGLAKLLGPKTADSALTGSQQIMGTPHYMAPEQMERPSAVDHRADIYSLGVVFYEMLTGELPLGRFAPPSKKVQVDVRLDEVVLRALEKEPERRYQHASDVKAEVETISRPEPERPAAHGRQGKAPSSKRFAIGVTIAALVVLAAAFMPWGEIRGMPQLNAPFEQPAQVFQGIPFLPDLFQAMEVRMTMTAWNGHITPVSGLKLPNYLVVLSAFIATALCWLKALSIWETPSALLFALPGYGMFHAGFALVMLMISEKGSAGVGSVLTVLAFAGMLVALIQQVRVQSATTPPDGLGQKMRALLESTFSLIFHSRIQQEDPSAASALRAREEAAPVIYPAYKDEEPKHRLEERPPTKTSGKAIASLVLGIMSIFIIPTAIPAIILAVMGMRDINRSQGQLGGRGLAIAGMITALCFVMVSIGVILFVGWNVPIPASRPPTDERLGPSELAHRLEAAQAITVIEQRSNALVAIAKDAAAAGEGEIVKRALNGITFVDLRDKAAAECALKLNKKGQRTTALEVAKNIRLIELRNQTLEQLAKGP